MHILNENRGIHPLVKLFPKFEYRNLPEFLKRGKKISKDSNHQSLVGLFLVDIVYFRYILYQTY